MRSNRKLKMIGQSSSWEAFFGRRYLCPMVNPRGLKTLQIRQARDSDIDDLVRLENECFGTYYREHKYGEPEFTECLYKKQAIFFVAILNSSLVGYVAGSVKTSRCQLSVHLDSVAVLPGARGKGVGDRLMQKFIEEAKQRACKKAMLEVAAANEGGIVFFSKVGFSKIRRLPGYYGEGLDSILMKLDI